MENDEKFKNYPNIEIKRLVFSAIDLRMIVNHIAPTMLENPANKEEFSEEE